MVRLSAKQKAKRGSSYSSRTLLLLGPDPHVTVLVQFDVDDVRAAAYWAVLDVFLLGTPVGVPRNALTTPDYS
jgi:hypothetical protein